MKIGESKTESEWRKLILTYLKNHEEENNHTRKIAEGIDTSTQTVSKYLTIYTMLGFLKKDKIAITNLYKITEKGKKELEVIE